ncbi:phosphate uptake regulator PhoU [Halorubrum distributum]|uniref:SpoVT/AbrB domain protein n=1 Tax=Halorubrum distributum JCM 10247 TaxID=1227486 RepID=M0D5F4_9EURY|nr:phosphate uptake regulator PhoU [Halorubrum terrestre]ELZ30726.1 SpoVT/AbrB domain protein [Halorubrum terrestre JCM 10247]
METRKLQEVGGGTFTVSIPRGWATTHGFEVGMELQLYTHRDGSILVRSSEADVDRLDDATIDVDGGTDAAERAVRTAYAVGFETATLRRPDGFDDAERKAVRSTTRDLVGMNVLSESDTEVTVGHLLDASSVSVCQSVVQLQYVVGSLLRDAAESFAEAADTHARVRDRADEARRSAEMVTRHFSRSLVSHAELDALGVSRPELFAYHATARRLGTLADLSVRIERTGERLSEPPAAEPAEAVRSAAADVACAVDDAVTAVLDDDPTGVRRARGRCDDAEDAIEAVERRAYDGAASGTAPGTAALSAVTCHLRRAVECGRSVADTAARSAVRAENVDG